MQNRQPMHLSSRQMTGPSSVLSIAFVRQADAHAGWLQCIHWFLTYTSPLSVICRFTTDHCVVDGDRASSSTAGSASGSANPWAAAQANSQLLHPMHRVVSTRIPMNSFRSPVSSAEDDWNGKAAVPTAPRVFTNALRSILSFLLWMSQCSVLLSNRFRAEGQFSRGGSGAYTCRSKNFLTIFPHSRSSRCSSMPTYKSFVNFSSEEPLPPRTAFRMDSRKALISS